MDINEDHPNKNKKAHFFRASYSKGLSHHQLCFGGDSKAGRELGFTVRKGRFQLHAGWRLWHREAVGKVSRGRTSCVIGWVHICLSSLGSKCETGVTVRETVSY